MLAHEPVARLMQAMGRLGVEAVAPGLGETISRLYWHTVEFGLAREGGEVKILGAGLASSFGEAHFAIEADVPRRASRFAMRRRPAYRSDAFQPLYFVSDSLERAAAELEALDLAGLKPPRGVTRRGLAAMALGLTMTSTRLFPRVSIRLRSAHPARRARLLRDRCDGGHLPRPARAAGRPDREQLHLLEPRPAAVAGLRCQGRGQRRPAERGPAFRVNVLQTQQQPASITFSTRVEDRFGCTPWSMGSMACRC